MQDKKIPTTRFRRFRALHHRAWMGGVLAGLLLSLIPACRWTPAQGIGNGTQSLTASDVIASHYGGLVRGGFKIPDSSSSLGTLKNLTWVFTHAEGYPLQGFSFGQTPLSSLTSEDLSRTQDPYFCAMRWDYGTYPEAGMKFFAHRKLFVISPTATLRAVVVRIVDWGPPHSSRGGIMLSKAALAALGIEPGSPVGVAFEADSNTDTGPVFLGAQN
jgi:hypothetical protein